MNESVKLVHADHTGMEKTRWDQTFSREEAEKSKGIPSQFSGLIVWDGLYPSY